MLIDLQTDPNIKISSTHNECYELLKKGSQDLQKSLCGFKVKKLAMLNKDREFFQYKLGDLVYIILSLTRQLRTPYRKLSVKCVGSVEIFKK